MRKSRRTPSFVEAEPDGAVHELRRRARRGERERDEQRRGGARRDHAPSS
jgi:hypothetical protein